MTHTMHFAGVCEPSPSHLMFMAAIGRALVRRSHRFTLFQSAEMAGWANREDVSFHNLDPYWRSADAAQPAGSLSQSMRYFCETLPVALGEMGIHCVLSDQLMPAGASVAEALALPFVTICNAIPMNAEPAIPPNFVPWRYDPTALGQLRNRMAYAVRDLFLLPANIVLNRYRRRWKLSPYRHPEDSLSTLAQISQMIAEFDFPRSRLPDCFHYVGPYRRHEQDPVPFPFDRLDGRPLAYLAFGTQIGPRPDIWKAVAEACVALDLQLVISAGKIDDAGERVRLPGDPVVVSFAPQTALLQRASVFITHGGLNSTLEALAYGVPLAAVPFEFDQPGVASRIVFHHVGQVLGESRTSTQAWRTAIAQILADRTYYERAQRFARLIQPTTGAERAAEIVDQAATTRRPVIA